MPGIGSDIGQESPKPTKGTHLARRCGICTHIGAGDGYLDPEYAAPSREPDLASGGLPGASSRVGTDKSMGTLFSYYQPQGYPAAFLQEGTENYKTMYGSLFHDMQVPAYNHPIHRPKAYQEFREISADFPSEKSIQALRGYGFHYLILQHRWFDGQSDGGWAEIEEVLAASTGIEVLADEGGFVVFEITK
jgi:hypothetical protein